MPTYQPRRTFCVWAGSLVIACVAAVAASAQPRGGATPPTNGPLRERLDALAASHAPSVPEGAITSIRYLLDTSERMGDRYAIQAAAWRDRASRYMAAAERGQDPYLAERGKIANRAYPSTISLEAQGYAVYVPPDYDPARAWPLMIVLHGGSSNGNLFLGVVLGNNMNWLTYPQYLYDEFRPVWSPEWIVAAPTGFGQVMWRWMGEQDVLDVIADVERHYNVDADRVVLGGLSNGGVGAYAIGTRHAWRFAAVQAMAGAPSWVQYTGGRRREDELDLLLALSGLHLAENTVNTDFRFYHGRADGGPMKPRFVDEFAREIDRLGIRRQQTWYDTGHDILYLVHRHGRIYDDLANVRRNQRPAEVRLITGDYRANRQHWLTVTRLEDPPKLARVVGRVQDDTLDLEIDGALALRVDIGDVPFAGDASVEIRVGGVEVYRGPRADLGDAAHLIHRDGRWQLGFPEEPARALVKKPGLSGPLTDAYFDRCVHVYGTQVADDTPALRAAAERGASGWPLWLWAFTQRVLADTEVTDALLQTAHLVVYGNATNNALLARMNQALPIRAEGDAIVVSEQRFAGRGVGARFIYPNPLAPERYVVVQTAPTTAGVTAGHNLPDFVPDYVVYDEQATRSRPRLIATGRGPLFAGFFDRNWRLREASTGPGEGDDSTHGSAPRGTTSSLPIPEAPPLPAPPATFLAPATDPAGRAARRIAARVPRFRNYRAEIPGAVWRTAPSVWSIRSDRDCLAELRAEGTPFRGATVESRTPVPTAVEITGPVDGVTFVTMHRNQPVIMACELAVRLDTIAAVLKRHGVTGVGVASSYRTEPSVSFHTMGLALDLATFETPLGRLRVRRNFRETPDAETCAGPEPPQAEERLLRSIACDLAATHMLSSVLTPNYNVGHRDHFHIDIRPDDPRLFLR